MLPLKCFAFSSSPTFQRLCWREAGDCSWDGRFGITAEICLRHFSGCRLDLGHGEPSWRASVSPDGGGQSLLGPLVPRAASCQGISPGAP